MNTMNIVISYLYNSKYMSIVFNHCSIVCLFEKCGLQYWSLNSFSVLKRFWC